MLKLLVSQRDAPLTEEASQLSRPQCAFLDTGHNNSNPVVTIHAGIIHPIIQYIYRKPTSIHTANALQLNSAIFTRLT